MLQTRIQTVLDGGVVSAVDVLYRIVDVWTSQLEKRELKIEIESEAE